MAKGRPTCQGKNRGSPFGKVPERLGSYVQVDGVLLASQIYTKGSGLLQLQRPFGHRKWIVCRWLMFDLLTFT